MAPRVSSFLITQNENQAATGSEGPKDYMARSWMPVSPELIVKLDQISSGNPQEVAEVLKTDLGACAFYLKNYSTYAEESGVPAGIINPSDLFNQAALLKFIEDIKSQQFSHTVDKATKSALSALKFAIISTTTAQTIAPEIDLDPQKAYLCSLTRQVGLMLVAWNYPRIFAKAQSSVTNVGGSIDREVSRILGHSPAQLASEICLNWEGAADIKAAVQTIEESSKSVSNSFEFKLSDADESEQGRLNYCMNLGDTMARIADPEHYPQYSKQWQNATEELKTCIGSNALGLIQDRLAGFSKAYSSDTFTLPISLEPRKNLTHTAIFRVTDRLLAENEWVAKCHKLHQERFKRIYGLIDKRGISTDALNELITNLMPDLGFVKGCMYKFDDLKMMLIPILRLGKTELSKLKALSCSDAKVLGHPAVIATSYNTPVVKDDVLVDNEWVTAIAAVSGSGNKKTVLYVELSEEMASSIDRREAIVHFKAIQKALMDCINL